jgi:hypothetical protein
VFGQAKTFHALDRAATVIGYAEVSYIEYKQAYLNVITEHVAEESTLWINSHSHSGTSVVVPSGSGHTRKGDP